MISKQTRNILTAVLRASSKVKLPSQTALSISKISSSNPLNPTFSIFANNPRNFFSTSSKDDNEGGDKDNSDKLENTKDNDNKVDQDKKEASLASDKQDEEATIDNQEVEEDSEDKFEPRKLSTIPIRPIKIPLEKGEEKLKQETYVLFSSTTPIIPFSQQTGFIKTGNLAAEHVSKKLAFFIQNEVGDIYTVGLVLEDDVSKTLKKNISQTIAQKGEEGAANDKSKHKTTISTKSKGYKIKLTEIEFKDNCIFVKGIPYKDAKKTKAEQDINVQGTLVQMKNLILSIRQSVSHEKLDAFNNLSFDSIYNKNVEPEKLDELLCNILGECQKLSHHTKEGLSTFVQAFLEQKSLIARMFMLKKKLEEIKSVLEIVNKSIQYADEQIWKFHEQAKARLSLDFIRSNYFSGETGAPGARPAGAQTGQAGGTPLSGAAKKFMEKLHMIPDEVSREKVRKEIERFSLQDKMSGEYHKLYTYLDEVFSIPWDRTSEEYWDIDYSKQVLEEKLYGLDKVKERIVEMIAVNKLKRAHEKGSDKKKGFVILLNGPPGTGKTTIAKAIAQSLRRENRFISFAGVSDTSFVKGHKRTYLDAQPGIFVKELIKSKVMNPVFILDEVDKLNKHFHGVDPYYALMEILNPEENQNFTDHYLDIKVDFSQVIFILTANQVLNMLEPLRNRLEIIEVPAYIEQEKLTIAKNYLIPAVMNEHGLPASTLSFDDETISRVVKGWCYYESGVRELKRCFEKIARKHALEILNVHKKEVQNQVLEPEPKKLEALEPAKPKEKAPAAAKKETTTTTVVEDIPLARRGLASQGIEFGVISNEVKTVKETKAENKQQQQQTVSNTEEDVIPLGTFNSKEADELVKLKNESKLVFNADRDPDDEILKKYLGNPVFDDMYERRTRKPFIGTANVLTVSGFVGHVMTVECIYDLSNLEKKGILSSSGNLQKVLQESLTIARLVAFRFLPPEKIKEISDRNVHVHFLQGGTQKDGPSAGLSICSAFLSLMLNKPVPQDISMTGELSLNGDVCKIGGVQAKVTASKALDINRIILPWGNKTEFFELPKLLKEGLTVYFVKEYREVFDIIFGESPEALKSIETYTQGKFVEPIRPVSIPQNAYLSMKNKAQN